MEEASERTEAPGPCARAAPRKINIIAGMPKKRLIAIPFQIKSHGSLAEIEEIAKQAGERGWKIALNRSMPIFSLRDHSYLDATKTILHKRFMLTQHRPAVNELCEYRILRAGYASAELEPLRIPRISQIGTWKSVAFCHNCRALKHPPLFEKAATLFLWLNGIQ
jgi:hypothetical protein